MNIREITGDGNCLFRAISDQLNGTEDMHAHYRHVAVDFIANNRSDFEPFIEDDQNFDDYITKIRKLTTWGGNMELQAISLILAINIKIHMLDNPI